MGKDFFKIQDVIFQDWTGDIGQESISIKSTPRAYTVDFIKNTDQFRWIEKIIKIEKKPIILVDEYIFENFFGKLKLNNIPTYRFKATEDNKTIETVLKFCNFLNENQANRGSMIFVIGGGIIQDVGAFSAAMLKRGIPWNYIPTTLLSQGDSCVGGKTAVNHNKTKNLLGLFSAPRKVLIDTTFCSSLSFVDRMSGGGEIYRLLITGGPKGFEILENFVDKFVEGSLQATEKLVAASLQVKKRIVDFDEFELNIRRSMNYGHSIGHAIEALTDYKIPHGIGIVIGILVENRISFNRGLLSKEENTKMYHVGIKLIPESIWKIFIKIQIEKILPFLESDKKAEGTNLKIATLRTIGEMVFLDLPLNEIGIQEIKIAFNEVISSFFINKQCQK